MQNETNYYLLLGLFDFANDLVGSSDDDPAFEAAFNAAKTQKERQWSSDKVKNSAKASRAGHSLDLLPKAKEHLDTMEKRKTQWEDAKNQVEKKIRQQINVFALAHSGAYLLQGEVDLVIKKVQKDLDLTIDQATVQRLAPSGIEIKQGEQAPAGKDLSRPKGYTTFHNTQSTLAAYGYSDFYDLLGKDRGVTKIRSTPAGQWAKWAREDKQALPNKATTEVADRRKLYGECARIFASEDKRSEYDNYMSYCSLDEVLTEMAEGCSVSKHLDASTAESYANRLVASAAKHGIPLDENEAMDYILGRCVKHGIAFAPPEKEGADTPAKKEVCFWCGTLIDQGLAVCPSCGGKTHIDCPKCGTSNPASAKFCTKCSMDFGDLGRASSLCDEAASAVDHLNFDQAQQLLADAEQLWKNLPDIAKCKARLEQGMKQFGSQVQSLQEAINANHLVEAKKLYQDIQKRAPQFDRQDLVERIGTGISTAQSIMDGEDPKHPDTQAVVRAYEACADYPGLAVALASTPPQAAEKVSVRVQQNSQCNVITWSPSKTKQASYLLVRKEGSRPLDAEDGETLVRTAGTSYTDHGLKANTDYCYAVASVLGPLTSDLTCSQPVRNLFDVHAVEVSASEGSIQIRWAGPPKPSEVEVWRDEHSAPDKPGKGKRVTNVAEGGLLDQGLSNGVTYYYTIFVKYRTKDGGAAYSSGQTCSGVPSSPPDPIDFMLPQLKEDGSFDLEWDNPDKGEARFYYSPEKVELTAGDIMPVSELETKVLPLSLTVKSADKGTFTLPDDQVYQLIAATVRNDTALVGCSTMVTSKQAVSITKVVASGANVDIIFEWPEDSENVLIAWRTDRFASAAGESGAASKLINRKTYDLHKAIELEGLELGVTYYFSLFAQLGTGDSASYSAPSFKTFSFGGGGKAHYQVEAKSFFGKVKSARLVLSSEVALPACTLRVQKESIPVFSGQGIELFHVPAQAEAGNWTFDLPAQLLNKGLYYKLFFDDPSAYDRIDLQLNPGTHPQIGK